MKNKQKRKIGKLFERYYEYNDSDFKNDQQFPTIFVSIASYRDPYCRCTINELFQKAKHPGRIFVGVCEQNEYSDINCMQSRTAKIFERNIKQTPLEADKAMGPMYARSLIEKLYNNEDFYLIIDSHMLFVEDWDEKIIVQLLNCKSDKPVLTCHPNDWNGVSFSSPQNTFPVYLTFVKFHKKLKLPIQKRKIYKSTKFPPYPLPSIFWAAGFSFSLGSMIKDVPYDPNYPYIFLGEEISMALRLYTHGYDLFSPNINIVFHKSDRTGRPLFWERIHTKSGVKKGVITAQQSFERKKLEERGLNRVYALLYGDSNVNFGKYGIGTARTREDFEKYTGVYIKDQKFAKRAKIGLTPKTFDIQKFKK